MLFYFRIGSYRDFDLSLISYDCQSVLLRTTALRDGPAVSAQCGTQAGGSTVRSDLAVVSELRSRQLARCVKVGNRGRQPLWRGVRGQHARPLSAR